MPASVTFHKYHGIGNDFILIEAPKGHPAWMTARVVTAWCDRHTGIGADGVLLIEPGQSAPFFMRVLNADGSEAEMCGNGIRCVAMHLHDRMGVTKEAIPIETLAGVKTCRLTTDAAGQVESVSVSLGRPLMSRSDVPMTGEGTTLRVPVIAGGRAFVGTGIGMGNPHFVVFDSVTEEEAARFGAVISALPLFPRQTNVEFVCPVGENHFRVIVYERGCGLTLACGTGAAATATAALLEGRAVSGRPILVDLPGGTLRLDVATDLSDVVLTGQATYVFSGNIVSGE